MRDNQFAYQIHKTASRYGMLFLLLMTGAMAFCQSPGSVYYVATNGNDQNAGTLSAPFQTLERARSAAMQAKGKDVVTIYLRGGEYYFGKIFSLTNKTWDSTRALRISSYQGEPVSFSGGIKLDNGKIAPVKDLNILQRLKPGARNNVFVTSLKDQGITDIGVMRAAGFGHPKLSSQSELFIDGQPAVLARAPNSGRIPIGTVDSAGGLLRDANAKGAIFHFYYPGSSRWTKDAAKNLWVSGYFNIGWSDETVPVAAISDSTVQLATPTVYGVKTSVKSQNNLDRDRLVIRGFYFFNILDELDTTGEYFIDHDNMLLYCWLPAKPAGTDIHLSVLNDPIISVINLSNISFEGIKFEYTRGSAVLIRNSTKISFNHGSFSNIGTDAISTGNCTGCMISRCKFFNIGASGVILDGGDRVSLVPSNNVVINSEFFHTGRLFRSFNPAINITGVASSVNHCYFHDLPGQAILYQGNDHQITNNNFNAICMEFSDVGAVGTGRDPSSAGTIIANNFFANVTCGPELMVTAIYIDDGSGGIKVHDNVFLNCGTSGSENSKFGFGAIEINGGSDNEFLNNIFINGRLGFSGGLWSDQKWQEYLNSDFIKKATTKDVNILSETYAKNYPFLQNFFDPNRKRNNPVRNSLVYNMLNFSYPQNNIVSNIYTEDNPELRSKKNYSDIVSFFKKHPYPQNVQTWTDWTPIDFGAIGIQPE